MRKSKVWIVTMLLAGLLAGCGSGSMKNASDMQTSSSGAHNSMMNKVEYSENYETDAMEDMAEESTEETNLGGQETGEQAPVVNGRKLIKTIDMRLETLTYDDTIAYIQNSVNKVGGYIESMSLEGDSIYSKNGNRYASLKVRIPEQKAQTFLSGLDENTTICEKNETTEDVTLQYVDVESHKAALQVEQERLMEILKKAETVEDIIEIESRLSQVRYEIGRYESKLRVYDNLIEYTTMYLDVYEVEEITEEPKEKPLERMVDGFADSVVSVIKGVREFIIGFVVYLPYIVVYGGIILGIVTLIKKIRKHRKNKKQKKQQE